MSAESADFLQQHSALWEGELLVRVMPISCCEKAADALGLL